MNKESYERRMMARRNLEVITTVDQYGFIMSIEFIPRESNDKITIGIKEEES